MSLVGFAGLLMALSAAYFADLRGSRTRLVVFTLLLVMHTAASFAFYLWVTGGAVSDTNLYYYDEHGLYGRMSGFGTAVVLFIVQELRNSIGGTFFDYFMIFQAAGFWGLVIVTKIIHEIYSELGAEPSIWIYLPLFLPGLHFRTGSIGKDGPIFMAVAMAVWASMRLGKRLFVMGLAIVIMISMRPHIALVALIALALAALIGRKTKPVVKALLLAGIAAAGYVIGSNFESTFHFDASNANSVTDYMSSRSGINETSGADTSIVQSGFPFKVFTLWFRPLFLDAENAMGYVASLENLVLLVLVGFLLKNFRSVQLLFFKVPFMRFTVVMFGVITILLALVNYNVGLGLRQKVMAMPCLLVILATLLALRSAQRSPPREPEPVPFRPLRGGLPAA